MRILLWLSVAALGCSANSKSSTPGQVTHGATAAPLVPRVALDVAVRDSQVYTPREMGVLYRYGSGDLQRDVYLYPKRTWGDPQKQAASFLEVLEIDRRRGRFDSFEVLSNAAFNMQIHDRVITGHEITIRMLRRGEPRYSYFAVVSLPESYFKIRATTPETTFDRQREFVRAWVEGYLQPNAR